MNTRHLVVRTLQRFKFLRYLNLTSNIEVNGNAYKVPVRGGLGFENLFMSEPWMARLLVKLKPFFTGAFIEVGVNVGQTMVKAYSVNEEVNYTGFEPNAICNHYLQQLIRLNKFENCKMIPAGVSDKSGILKLNFFYSTETDASATLIHNFRPNEAVHHFSYLPVLKSDDLGSLLPEIGHCILKIDGEGAELEVLRTFSKWISGCQPLVLVEILPAYSTENEFRIKRQQEIKQLVESWNYGIARINKGETISLSRIDEIGIHSDIENGDYVLYPLELEPDLRSLFVDKPEAAPTYQPSRMKADV